MSTRETQKIRKLTKEVELLQTLARPFIEAQVYNPNNSDSIYTRRTLNVRAVDIQNLRNYFQIRELRVLK